MWLLVILMWGLGFCSRVVTWHGRVQLKTREKMYLVFGVPISRDFGDLAGSVAQINAYLVVVSANILFMFIQDQVLWGGVVGLLALPSIWIALGIVRLLARKLQ